ncbi:30 kDa heat shock protein [Lachnellula hyalina]|uniref:30 kDa heat shock protein n=1 Tax=Lachnellula hyalina TaxID=1316788 RepID=A0A8H8R6I6_9HELO|nr:30 kDa heat shock protein [Lachnellula hyalina]TVY28921.1 30 kDa heat shock protein [Lachnellula hyalina]
MPFFPQAYLSPEAGLFQILSELDQPQQKTCVRRQTPRTFTPRFDVTETAQAYELFGEVAGLEQQDLSIEFADAQTLIVKGKTERGPSTTQAPEVQATQPQSTDASSEKSHTPTVEDAEYDEADTPLATPASTATVTETPSEEQKQAKAPAPKPRYWVAERRVGTFERSFSFSQRIDQDAVEASLHNGVLHVVVPKSQKSKKVAVSVN